MINCDSKLTKLFGDLDRINFYDVISKIKEFLIPVEPIEIDYQIILNEKNEIFVDISIEMVKLQFEFQYSYFFSLGRSNSK